MAGVAGRRRAVARGASDDREGGPHDGEPRPRQRYGRQQRERRVAPARYSTGPEARGTPPSPVVGNDASGACSRPRTQGEASSSLARARTYARWTPRRRSATIRTCPLSHTVRRFSATASRADAPSAPVGSSASITRSCWKRSMPRASDRGGYPRSARSRIRRCVSSWSRRSRRSPRLRLRRA